MKKILVSVVVTIGIFLGTLTPASASHTDAPEIPAETAGMPVVVETPRATPVPIVENLPSDTPKDIEKDIWDCIVEITGSETLAAAMMGNAHRESRMCPYRWEDDVETDENGEFPLSRKYTDKVNDLLKSKNYISAKNTFVNMNPLHNWAGFGLYMFTARGHKINLISFCITNGYLIDDPIAQTRYVLYYILTEHPEVYTELCNETHLYKCVKLFANKFEKCECSETGTYDRCYWARQYFEKFGTSELVR